MSRAPGPEELYRIMMQGHGRRASRPRVEEYLETIHELEKVVGWVRIKDLSAVLNVKPSSATKAVRRLSEKGLVIYEKYRGARLSEAGRRLVHSLGRKHAVIAELLTELGLDGSEAQAEAERLEHVVSERVVRAMEAFLERYRNLLARCSDA